MQDPDLKVVYAASENFSQPSAPAINILEMCNAFAKLKWATTLCVPASGQDKDFILNYYGIEQPFEIIEITLPKPFSQHRLPGQNAAFAILAAQKLGKMKNHLIYTRCPWIFFMMSVLYNQPCFFEAHQFRYARFMQSAIFRTLVKLGVVWGNGAVVCISAALMKQWQSCGINRGRLFVAHDAVNPQKFHNTYAKQEAREQLKMAQDIPVVVYTGSLIAGKGVDVLVKSANLLPGVSFVIVGGKLPQIAALSQLVQRGNVTFTGHVPPGRIPLYQAAADVLALPNTKGSVIDDVTSPMKLFEYIASNRPIVATDIPSIMEILADNHNALLSRAGDSYQLSKNIDALLVNPALAEQLSRNALHLLDRYTWDRRAVFLTELFTNDQSMRGAASASAPRNLNEQET
jgi:glycosyltransferase involved in cell wall biosynthesis